MKVKEPIERRVAAHAPGPDRSSPTSTSRPTRSSRRRTSTAARSCIAYETVELPNARAAAADADVRGRGPDGGAGGREVPREAATAAAACCSAASRACRRRKVVILGGGIVGINAAKMAAGLGAQGRRFSICRSSGCAICRDVMPANVHAHLLEPAQHPRADRDGGSRGRRGADPGREGAAARAARGSQDDAAGLGDRGRRDRPGRLRRDDPRDDARESRRTSSTAIIHYGVANMPGGVPRTSTLALTNATLPYAMQLANKGWKKALRENDALLEGAQRGRQEGGVQGGGGRVRDAVRRPRRRISRHDGGARVTLPPVLAWHKVERRHELGVTRISPRRFAKQIERLARAGWKTLGLEEVIACAIGERIAAPNELAITFDDGYRGLREHAFPVLEAHGFRATCFVITDYAGRLNRWDVAYGGRRFAHLAWRDMRAWQGRGIEFASHTATHPRLTRCSSDVVRGELERSRRAIAAALGVGDAGGELSVRRRGREGGAARARGRVRGGFGIARGWSGSVMADCAGAGVPVGAADAGSRSVAGRSLSRGHRESMRDRNDAPSWHAALIPDN